LSITTFRYVPLDIKSGSGEVEEYLNRLNTELLTHIQNSGQAYISNAVIDGKFLLRACIVNFRTSLTDIQALPGIVLNIGRELDKTMRPERLKT
jgi:glutamate/tyrosine decarboxylase-like PLP-dependent enzyme